MDPSYRPSRRRSVPRLPEFSITPLRTHLEDSLADEYGVHSYSQPQTPRSPRSAFHSPSHTPTVLSRASSRDPSRNGGRRKRVKSALLLAELERPLATGKSDTTAELLPTKSRTSLKLHKVQTDVGAYPTKGHIPKSKSMGSQAVTGARPSSSHGLGTDWLLSTASVLAMTTAESKGQSWLATKSASTSLVGTPYVEKDDFIFRTVSKSYDGQDLLDSPPLSKPGTRRNSSSTSLARERGRGGGSRSASRIGSRAASRVNLTGLHTRSYPEDPEHRTDYFSNMGIDYADQGMDDEQDDGEDDLDEYEEGELKKLVWGRVGGWVDWAVGWMDWRDGLQGIDEEEDARTLEHDSTVPQTDGRQKKKRRAAIRPGVGQDIATNISAAGDSASIPAAPQATGVVGDVKWLFGVVGKLIV